MTGSNVFDEDARTEIYQQRGNGQHVLPHAAGIYMRFGGGISELESNIFCINIYTINGWGNIKTTEKIG